MGELTRVTQGVRSGAADMSHVTDLAIVDGQLYASTRHDGTLDSWTISGAGLSLRDAEVYAGILRPGDTGWITVLDLNAGATLLTGGGTAGALTLRDPAANGALPGGTTLAGTTNVYGSLHHTTVIDPGNGTHVVYGGMAGQGGLAQITFDDAGVITAKRTVGDLNRTYAADIAGTATATVGGNTYLYTASATENGISSWSVASNGNLVSAHDMGNPEGLWVSAPTALASAQIGGRTFLVVAAAGTDSLTVLRTEADGSLTVTDHLLDTRDTRFGGVAALEVVAYRGAVYVIAGGGDDGITVLQMLPDGQLVTRATIADSTTMTLDNVSAIAATGSGDGLDIFVASSSEDGITRLRYDIGPAGLVLTAQAAGETLTGGAGGDLLTGRDGDDRLFGGGGDDILRDGAGSDLLVGNAGADLFVLSRDGTVDTIKDFAPGIDRIDLSGWDFLRDRAQLTFAITSTGFTITYGDEFLIVQSADGNPIDHRQIPTMDLMGGARIPIVIRPGYPGPVMPAPDIPGESTPTEVTTDAGAAPRSPTAGITTIAGLRFTLPRMAATNGLTRGAGDGNNRLEGLGRHDMLAGGGGDDILVGRGGSDRLYGGSGNDRLEGDSGDDRLEGQTGRDILFGGGGQDILSGSFGNDRLVGGAGDDLLTGGPQNDYLYGSRGNDRVYGGSGSNRIYGDAGSDLLRGGNASDWIYGGLHGDVLFGGGGRDLLTGFHGNDRLYGGSGADVMYGQRDSDILNGGGGADRIFGGSENDTLNGARDSDLLNGDAGNDVLIGGPGGDTLIGGSGDDLLNGGADDDLLFGGDGADLLRGSAGADVIRGWSGDDTIFGGTGDDLIRGEAGADRIEGNDGADRIFGDLGRDRLFGGAGDDRLDGGIDHDTLLGGDGNDILLGGDGNDRMSGDAGDDRLWGGDAHDVLLGGDGNDILAGDAGHDSLLGGAGDDILSGGEGNDWMAGGGGDDRLTGGAGNDTFVFVEASATVTDFNIARDRLTLETQLWGGTALIPGDVLFLYAHIDGTDTVLDFGEGRILTLEDVTDWAAMADRIDYI